MEFSSISLALNLVSNLFIESESFGIPPPIYKQSSKEEEEDSIWDAGMNKSVNFTNLELNPEWNQ